MLLQRDNLLYFLRNANCSLLMCRSSPSIHCKNYFLLLSPSYCTFCRYLVIVGNGLFQMNCKCKLSFPNQHMKLCHYEPQGLAMCLWCQLDDISFFDLCFQIYLVLEVSISDQALNYTTIVRANLGPWILASCFSRCSDIMFL